MAVNTESRAAASKFQTSYHSDNPTDANVFLNLDIDTLFLINAKPLSLRYDLAPPANVDSGPRKVPKIAIPWETWYDLLQSAESYWWNPSGGEILMETMKKIHDLGVEEILLVASCNKNAYSLNRTNIEFVKPTRELPADESHWNKFLELLGLESPHFEWEKVALAVQLFIQAVQGMDLQYMMELRKSMLICYSLEKLLNSFRLDPLPLCPANGWYWAIFQQRRMDLPEIQVCGGQGSDGWY
jgi:hypothetical protein